MGVGCDYTHVVRLRTNLKQLSDDRFNQAHVLGTTNRQPIQTKVPYNVRHRIERLTKFAQNIFSGIDILLDAHMHKTFGASGIVFFLVEKNLSVF